MSDPMPTNVYTRRWHALLAESSVLQKEHLDLLSSVTPPFSAQHKIQLEASTARIQQLNRRLHVLVNDWSTEARSK
jgi:hypothetical protein